ncbi:hypothetical protein L7F22_032146 [Adiantum nelumboides]|nr:hypothetical protein [Adiantum nelumboides]
MSHINELVQKGMSRENNTCAKSQDTQACRAGSEAMAYVEGGNIKSRRSLLRLSIFSDLFWGIVHFIAAFFTTMFSLEAANGYGKKRSDSRASRGWGGGPGGGGPPGGPGFGPRPNQGPRGMSNVKGIDHNSLPACGSCCGG